jgi:ABC-type multidrug transport system ATPase subunit
MCHNGPKRCVLSTNIPFKLKNSKSIISFNCVLFAGCGKTSLLDVLAKRVDASPKNRSLTGNVKIKPEAKMRYVQQEEALVGVLTTRETLVFAARLAGAPLSRTDELLDEMGAVLKTASAFTFLKKRYSFLSIENTGLSSCADTTVGTIFIKGISGGQKRRLSIAVELVSDPTLLLLDEPTSGLDSASALRVVQHMHYLAKRKNVAVVATLHQPSHDMWELLDLASFLSGGKLVYFGDPGQRLLDFLADIHHEVPIHANIPDHVLSITNADFAETGKKVAEIDEMVAKFAALKRSEENESNNTHKDKAQQQEDSSIERPANDQPNDELKRPRFGKRLIFLIGRDFKELGRDPGIIGVRILMYTLLSFVIGVMFLKLGNDKSDSSILSRTSVLFYVGAFMVFMSIAVLPFFVTQRGVFTKERCNGTYKVPEYVLSKFIVSLPGVFALAIIPSLLIVLPALLNGFGIYLSTLFLSLLMAEAFMSFIAACVPHYIIGIALAAGLFGFFMLCQGFFIVKDDIPPYLIWGYYIAPHTYIFQLFMYV